MVSASTLRLPRWATPALYVGMGWVALVPAPSLAATLPWSAVSALVGDGALYTIGALVFLILWSGPV
jgi:hemolysin III